MGSCIFFFFFSSRRRHTRFKCDWSSDVCSSDLHLLHQLPLAPQGIQNLQQQRPQQLLRRNRRPPPPRVQRLEVRRQLLQRTIQHGSNPPQRMIGRNPLFRVDIAEHRSLLLVVSTHTPYISHCLVETLVSFHALRFFQQPVKPLRAWLLPTNDFFRSL